MIVNRSIGSYGRFANGMFQIAAVIGTARKYGHPFGFEPWVNYDHRDRFGSSEDIDLQKYFVNPLPEINNSLDYEQINVNWGYDELNIPSSGNWDIRGHFQSDKWFKDSIEEVRHYFRMKDEPKENPFTAIHYRAGDYEDNPDAYHPRLTVGYYRRAMEHIPGPYIVFSDSIDEARQLFEQLNQEIYYSNLDYIKDFAFMKTCKHFICGNSSYSLMAAILSENSDKKIVCPKKWFGDIANLPTHDLYPEEAIVI